MKPTQEQVIAWAREASRNDNSRLLGCGIDDLERLAALAYEAGRKDENEACAKVCEVGAEQMLHKYKREDAARCASAIRARREQ